MATGILSKAETKEPNMTREAIIRFQVMVYCHLHSIPVTASDVECLTAIGLKGKSRLSTICTDMVQKGVFSSSQSIRNSLDKLQDKGLIEKEQLSGKSKAVYLSDSMKIATEGSILVDIKCLYKEQ